MYSEKWSRELRQGDVFGPHPYPKFKGLPQSLVRVEGRADTGEVNRWEFTVDAQFAIIVSHCCEFNEGKRPRFLVARVQEFPPRLEPEERVAIENSNDAIRETEDDTGHYDYGGLFVLDPLPGCFEEKQIVDFTTIMPFAKSNMEPTVRELKRAELEQDERVKLRKKIAYFVGRDAPDVNPDRKIDPWNSAPA